MSGSQNNPGSDQFSLVSLEKSQKAASSYSSMSKRVRGEADSTLDVSEDDAKSQLAAKSTPKEEPKPVAKPATAKPKPSPAKTGDLVDDSLDDIINKLAEFNQSVRSLFSNASQAGKNISLLILTPLLPLLNRLLKLLNGPLQFINLLTRKINERMSKRRGSTELESSAGEALNEEMPEAEVVAPVQAAAQHKSSNFSDMLELNITFTDNMKKPLYKRKPNAPGTRMGTMEEELVFSNAILAISECAEFTSELPNPASGIYAGQRIYDIMANATKDDVGLFLAFVKAYPGKYIGKEWKISETFATWLINNAPLAE